MIEKYMHIAKRKKYAFLPLPTATNPLNKLNLKSSCKLNGSIFRQRKECK